MQSGSPTDMYLDVTSRSKWVGEADLRYELNPRVRCAFGNVLTIRSVSKVKVILAKTTIYIERFNERKVSPTTMDASLCTCGESSGQNLHRAERLGAHQDQARAPFVHQSEIIFFLISIVIVLNYL